MATSRCDVSGGFRFQDTGGILCPFGSLSPRTPRRRRLRLNSPVEAVLIPTRLHLLDLLDRPLRAAELLCELLFQLPDSSGAALHLADPLAKLLLARQELLKFLFEGVGGR